MFVTRDEFTVIDTSVFNTSMPVFALEPTGLPLETADANELDGHELFQDAWKVCRLIWDYEDGAVKKGKESRYNLNFGRNAVFAQTLVHSKPKSSLNQRKLSKETYPDAQRLEDDIRIPSSNMRETANEPLAGRPGKRKLEEHRMTSSHPPAAKSRRDAMAKTSRTQLSGRAHAQSEKEERRGDVEEGAYRRESTREMTNDDGASKGVEQPFGLPSQAPQLQYSRRQSAQSGKSGPNSRSVETQHLEVPKTSSLPALSQSPRNASAPQRIMKPRNPSVLIWPTTIITTGASGTHLRPLMEQMGEILSSDLDRQEYMHLVWTRRRAIPKGDETAMQPVVDDLEKFVRRHDIVGLHNLWAGWMDPGIKTRMPMFKIGQPGVMND